MLTGSISGAAKMLDVSSPAVSCLISSTEQRLGLIFFKRIKGRLYPTPEAQRLFLEVDAVYQGGWSGSTRWPRTWSATGPGTCASAATPAWAS